MRLTKDLLAGLMFCAFGIGAAIIAYGYEFGSPARMGSGFFPVVVGALVAAMGLILVVRAIIWPQGSEPIAHIPLRPFLFISVAIIAFGLLIEDAGLVAALAALIVVARFAGREGSFPELTLMVAVLIAIAVAIFIYGLGIRLPLGP